MYYRKLLVNYFKNNVFLYINLRKLAAAIILGWLPRECDGLTRDFFILQRTLWWSGFVQNSHLETALIYAATVLQQ